MEIIQRKNSGKSGFNSQQHNVVFLVQVRTTSKQHTMNRNPNTTQLAPNEKEIKEISEKVNNKDKLLKTSKEKYVRMQCSQAVITFLKRKSMS